LPNAAQTCRVDLPPSTSPHGCVWPPAIKSRAERFSRPKPLNHPAERQHSCDWQFPLSGKAIVLPVPFIDGWPHEQVKQLPLRLQLEKLPPSSITHFDTAWNMPILVPAITRRNTGRKFFSICVGKLMPLALPCKRRIGMPHKQRNLDRTGERESTAAQTRQCDRGIHREGGVGRHGRHQ